MKPGTRARKSGSSFYYALWLLPRDRREALFRIYNLCRALDDAVDQAPSLEAAREALGRWEREIQQTYEGRPSHPLTREVLPVLEQYEIPQKYWMDLLAGLEMDLTQTRYPTFRELHRYCYRVASVVGLMCLEVFGYENALARAYAVDLGIALQLTNILRDLPQDAQQGRIYLPLEDLYRYRYTEADLLQGRYTPAFVELMRFECDRAREYFQRAEESLPPEDRERLRPARAMAETYRTLLDRIEEARYNVFAQTPRVSTLEKLWILLRIRFSP